MNIQFENYEVREKNILKFLHKDDVSSILEAKEICHGSGLDVFNIVKGIQPISFDDACWAYIVGSAAAIKRNSIDAKTIAYTLGEGLQSFCIDGSVSDDRKIGIGHGKLASMVLDESIECFAFLAGHESFAAAEGAIGIANSANKVRKKPLRVILNGLGKDAAEIISRINGFTYVKTAFNLKTGELSVIEEIPYSEGNRALIKCYGSNEMREGVAVMELENVDISISGNATNMIKFQHPVAGAYKKVCLEKNKYYFACASGGGIGRTMNTDDISAGPASYGYTDMMSRMYADATFAGSSSVPAHVEMMGFIGMGNNPIVGATVSIAVKISELLSAKQ